MKMFKISEDLLKELGKYLMSKPMGEVRMLVEALEKNIVEIKEEEKKDQ